MLTGGEGGRKYDRFRNRLWICTGDHDHESAFYYTDDEFSTVHRFAGGDQSWRAIALLFDESGMEWGMDAGKDAPADAVNRIYRFEFATGQRRELAVIGNPAYAACEFIDGTAVMQTTFDRVWRKAFSAPYRLQPGEGRGLYGMLLMPGGVQPVGQVLFTPTHCSAGNRRMHSIQMNAVYDN